MFNPNLDWIESKDDNPFDCIQITNKERLEIRNPDEFAKDSLGNIFFRLGCIALLIFALFLAVVVLVSFVGWF